MKVRLLVVSHRPPSWVAEGATEYERRLPREWKFELVELKPGARTAGQPAAKVQADEAVRLRAALPKGACLVALDERGEGWSTAQLAERLRRWQQQGRDLAFVVGGADGLDPELVRSADQRWSLSALTLPHGLVRVVVVEQLYRAASLLAGHPYHRP
ncbi:MAG: 23S rRNA (pseudouridine(1915)-N(3))-methyltransferase RlmH [Planctomycetes bacterium]|nr:23S rRNA (pseudouridine(1915)-N(3))-methyltransferase RlmH [Planctomycetota bacterium]